MPIYEYQCLNCGERIEALLTAGDRPPEECPSCGGRLAKVLSKPGGFQFKGPGFYATDYGRGSSSCCGQSQPCNNPKRCCEKE